MLRGVNRRPRETPDRIFKPNYRFDPINPTVSKFKNITYPEREWLPDLSLVGKRKNIEPQDVPALADPEKRSRTRLSDLLNKGSVWNNPRATAGLPMDLEDEDYFAELENLNKTTAVTGAMLVKSIGHAQAKMSKEIKESAKQSAEQVKEIAGNMRKWQTNELSKKEMQAFAKHNGPVADNKELVARIKQMEQEIGRVKAEYSKLWQTSDEKTELRFRKLDNYMQSLQTQQAEMSFETAEKFGKVAKAHEEFLAWTDGVVMDMMQKIKICVKSDDFTEVIEELRFNTDSLQRQADQKFQRIAVSIAEHKGMIEDTKKATDNMDLAQKDENLQRILGIEQNRAALRDLTAAFTTTKENLQQLQVQFEVKGKRQDDAIEDLKREQDTEINHLRDSMEEIQELQNSMEKVETWLKDEAPRLKSEIELAKRMSEQSQEREEKNVALYARLNDTLKTQGDESRKVVEDFTRQLKSLEEKQALTYEDAEKIRKIQADNKDQKEKADIEMERRLATFDEELAKIARNTNSELLRVSVENKRFFTDQIASYKISVQEAYAANIADTKKWVEIKVGANMKRMQDYELQFSEQLSSFAMLEESMKQMDEKVDTVNKALLTTNATITNFEAWTRNQLTLAASQLTDTNRRIDQKNEQDNKDRLARNREVDTEFMRLKAQMVQDKWQHEMRIKTVYASCRFAAVFLNCQQRRASLLTLQKSIVEAISHLQAQLSPSNFLVIHRGVKEVGIQGMYERHPGETERAQLNAYQAVTNVLGFIRLRDMSNLLERYQGDDFEGVLADLDRELVAKMKQVEGQNKRLFSNYEAEMNRSFQVVLQSLDVDHKGPRSTEEYIERFTQDKHNFDEKMILEELESDSITETKKRAGDGDDANPNDPKVSVEVWNPFLVDNERKHLEDLRVTQAQRARLIEDDPGMSLVPSSPAKKRGNGLVASARGIGMRRTNPALKRKKYQPIYSIRQ